ncbi:MULTISPECIES: hydantoinase/oxoprolinase N-terminal domain-containing protein [Sorangium]|uniref:N-methylhydantoinase A, beta-subunit (ATP-hydrolyzing) n=1 Tax=Sorangium cellulosum (strain So ce56) TaxID=448385 RepID=A9G752_SORC5|nr:hydantoinase/oxoprolinase family protein [Sorangium cellulosum]CAN92779.1 N-methylhydantoinase A, beta-subunit (ATP-hydrolyzing) [Sorangium cellulosum So ce56]
MRMGIDVGGTNTDAVMMDGADVVATVKVPTTADVSGGVLEAVSRLLERARVPVGQIRGVMLGTTHFTNALVERRRLQEVAAVRLGLPATAALPPMVDWPCDLRRALGDHGFLAHGGHEFDGRRLSPVEAGELRRIAREIGRRGLRSVAIASVFSPVNPEAELEAAAILREVLPDASLSLSHEIGRMGLLERENAAILNACLKDVSTTTIRAFHDALARAGVLAPLYLTQNDGTLMSSDRAERYPAFTLCSGPTNSMRGAAFLTGLTDAMVVDIGGTTTDVGALRRGLPREASMTLRVAGVRCNFRMPDVLSIGLGGGSHVLDGPLRIGARSAGHELTQRALVFGGDTLTATDIAVAAGCAVIGDRAKVAHLPDELVARAALRIHEMVEAAIDRGKPAAADIPVVLVGGGSSLICRPLQGTSEIIRPQHAEVANAVGAAIAHVSGEVDRVVNLESRSRDDALAEAQAEAIAKASAAGADPASIHLLDIEEVPLAYLPSSATRIRVKAIGDLRNG